METNSLRKAERLPPTSKLPKKFDIYLHSLSFLSLVFVNLELFLFLVLFHHFQRNKIGEMDFDLQLISENLVTEEDRYLLFVGQFSLSN